MPAFYVMLLSILLATSGENAESAFRITAAKTNRQTLEQIPASEDTEHDDSYNILTIAAQTQLVIDSKDTFQEAIENKNPENKDHCWHFSNYLPDSEQLNRLKDREPNKKQYEITLDGQPSWGKRRTAFLPIEGLLSACQELKVISLSIHRMPSLMHMILFAPKASPPIFTILKNDNHLISFDLSFNELSPRGLEAIITALKLNTTVTRLNLSNNKINQNGAEIIAKLIKVNNSLRMLEIECNNIKNKGVIKIIHAIGKNKKSNIEFLNFNINDLNFSTEEEENIRSYLGKKVKHLTLE